MLGDISFWLGSGLCLGILLASCGCRRAYCGRESVRVLASLLGSYPSGVRHLSRVLFLSLGPCRSRSPIPSPLLLGGVLVRLCGGLFCRSMAMSWRAIRFSLRRSRLSIPFAMSPLSRRVFADSLSPLRAVALAEGRLPMHWVPSEPMGFAVAPPLSPYTRPGQSPQFYRSPLGAQVGVSYFSCASFLMYSWR